MRLPIDTVAVQFMSAGPAEPVLDFETKAQRTDGNGQLIFSVHLFAISPDSYDTLTVKVAGEPKGIANFTPVKVTNLIASTWDIGGNHGVSFKADKIEARKAGQLMAWLLIGLVLVTIALWALGWALAHYGAVLLLGAVLCGWFVLKAGRNG